MSELIKLDLSGTIIVVAKETLIRSEYFKALLSNKFDYTSESSIFIDCDPNDFKYILDNLRYGNEIPEKLEKLADFFCIKTQNKNNYDKDLLNLYLYKLRWAREMLNGYMNQYIHKNYENARVKSYFTLNKIDIIKYSISSDLIKDHIKVIDEQIVNVTISGKIPKEMFKISYENKNTTGLYGIVSKYSDDSINKINLWYINLYINIFDLLMQDYIKNDELFTILDKVSKNYINDLIKNIYL